MSKAARPLSIATLIIGLSLAGIVKGASVGASKLSKVLSKLAKKGKDWSDGKKMEGKDLTVLTKDFDKEVKDFDNPELTKIITKYKKMIEGAVKKKDWKLVGVHVRNLKKSQSKLKKQLAA